MQIPNKIVKQYQQFIKRFWDQTISEAQAEAEMHDLAVILDIMSGLRSEKNGK